MDTARKDRKPIVYIGFGSITVPNPAAMTRAIVKAVLKSDVRAIVSKGWSARMSKSDEPEVELPPECYSVSANPDLINVAFFTSLKLVFCIVVLCVMAD